MLTHPHADSQIQMQQQQQQEEEREAVDAARKEALLALEGRATHLLNTASSHLFVCENSICICRVYSLMRIEYECSIIISESR
jgi:hypothetical protein